jgi:tetratricopeptide (TPR) repeat protein
MWEAEQHYRQSLQINPTRYDLWHSLGIACHVQRKLSEAVASYEQALALWPDYALAHAGLGAALIDLGKRDEATKHLRRALALDPGNADAHSNLGVALRGQGKAEEAIACFQTALQIRPDFANAHYNLGNALRQVGKLAEAVESYRRALQFQPSYVDAYNNLGSLLGNLGELDEAAACLRQALALNPGHAEAHNNLGNVLTVQDLLDEALACYRRALELRPNFANALNNVGATLSNQGKLEEALTYIREALRLQPDYAEAHCNLGWVLQQLGDLPAAEAAFEEALRHDPRHPGSRAHLVVLRYGRQAESDRAAVYELLADSRLPENERSRLHFRAGQLHDERGEYADAVKHFQAANAIDIVVRRKRGKTYDPVTYARFVDQVIEIFSPEFFARVRGWGSESQRPVFIFGMPRSGTTLVEQILASHSQVHGAGEVGLGESILNALGKAERGEEAALATMRTLDRNALLGIAGAQLDKLDSLNGTAARVVDKMPENYLYLGLLAVLFPQARFIHCRRDLRDVAVSCWQASFNHVSWANDFDHIASHIRQYRRLMDHWRRVLPVPMVEVSYEAVVSDLETEARRLLAACGLDWEPACLAFHKTRRPVRTSSVVQVRQPLYARSVGRWRHYAEPLTPLFAALDACGEAKNPKG